MSENYIEYTTDKGISVKIGICPFSDAGKLKTVIVRELKNSNIDFGSLIKEFESKIGQDISSLSKESFNTIAQTILSTAGSSEIERSIFPCLTRSTYDDKKILPDTFDDLDARAEYFKIISLCIKLNVFPFFMNLGSLLSILQ
jgi:hypothetical protein